jgi:hypothetical protein
LVTMEIVNQYFKDLIFTKVEPKEGVTIYAAAVSATLADGKKQYVLVLVPSHMAIVDRAHMHELHWQNVQTRYLLNGYRLAPQRWSVPKGARLLMFNIVSREVTRSTYLAENGIPLEMDLIHDPKKKSIHQYYDKMNIVGAISTFRCSITSIAPTSIPLSQLPAHSAPIVHPRPTIAPPPPAPVARPTFARAPISSMMKVHPRPANVPHAVQQQARSRPQAQHDDSFELV